MNLSLCKYSAEPSRVSAYSCDLRWRIVYQHLGMGLSCRDVAKHLNFNPSTISSIVSRFDETGSVYPTDRKGVTSELSDYDENIIIENLLEKPGMYLHELQYKISNITGTQVDESTICRFLKRNNFTHKLLSHLALQRNSTLREQYLSDVSIYDPESLTTLS